MAIDASFYTNKKSKSLYGSIGALILVCLATAGMWGYNAYLENQNTQIQDKVKYFDGLIAEAKKDKAVQVYDLVKINQKALEKLTIASNMKNHVKYIQDLGSKYGIVFNGFNFTQGVISTTATIVSNENGSKAFAKLVNFISQHRKDDTRLFDLEFIHNVSGNENMLVDVKFISK